MTEHCTGRPGCRCSECERLYEYATKIFVGMNGDPETASIGVFPAEVASHLATHLASTGEAICQYQVKRAEVHYLALADA